MGPMLRPIELGRQGGRSGRPPPTRHPPEHRREGLPGRILPLVQPLGSKWQNPERQKGANPAT